MLINFTNQFMKCMKNIHMSLEEHSCSFVDFGSALAGICGGVSAVLQCDWVVDAV